jgi:hypothetical protein
VEAKNDNINNFWKLKFVNYRMKLTYPPYEFDIRRNAEYGNFALLEATSPLAAAVLIHVDEAAKIYGGYRIVLGGNEMIRLDVPAKEVLFMGESDSYRIQMEMWSRDIHIRENMMSSDWIDLVDR